MQGVSPLLSFFTSYLLDDVYENLDLAREAEIWTFPSTPLDSERYAAFKRLNKRGYSMTSGSKFGGDFLGYRGTLFPLIQISLTRVDDPSRVHSEYIVKCMTRNQRVNVRDLVKSVRLATDSNKKVLYTSSGLEAAVCWTGWK